jgi:predicted enzyme related to lactoylglutathione lyase
VPPIIPLPISPNVVILTANSTEHSSHSARLVRGALAAGRCPRAKRGKNRLHLDLRTRDLDAEAGRVRELGATVQTIAPIEEGGWTWHILEDPDGNEFCVLQPPPDYWEQAQA